MKLNLRLKTIAELVKKGSVLADIGTDHAYVPIYLIKEGVVKKAIVTDISPKSLEKAAGNVKRYGLGKQVELRQGNGLTPINEGEVDTVIIAGMGGILIRQIMEDASTKLLNRIGTFILQPMLAQDVVRRWITENGLKITNERLSREDNRYYQIIQAEHGSQQIKDDFYFELGEFLIENKDPLLEGYVKHKINSITQTIRALEHSKTDGGMERISLFRHKLSRYEEVLRWSASVKI